MLKAKENLELVVYGPEITPLNHNIDEIIDLTQYLDFIEVYKKSSI